MRTDSGLTIHRVDEEQGGFHIELKAPAEHDPEESTFAVIRWDRGRWNWRNSTMSPDILKVINGVERQYAGQQVCSRSGTKAATTETRRIKRKFRTSLGKSSCQIR